MKKKTIQDKRFRLRWMFLGVIALVVAGIFLGGGGIFQKAHAALITFEFEGIVNSVDPELAGTYNTTQTLSGTYTFDSDAADIDGGTNGAYDITSLTFSLGGNTYTSTAGLINVADDNPTDRYGLNAVSFSGPSVGAFAPERFGFILQSTSTSVFTSDALPLTPPDLTNFDVLNQWSFRYIKTGDTQFAGVRGLGTAGLTKLAKISDGPAPVPEPSTLLLLGSGLVGLAGYGRRKFKK
jgi:hypothetical protein